MSMEAIDGRGGRRRAVRFLSISDRRIQDGPRQSRHHSRSCYGMHLLAVGERRKQVLRGRLLVVELGPRRRRRDLESHRNLAAGEKCNVVGRCA